MSDRMFEPCSFSEVSKALQVIWAKVIGVVPSQTLLPITTSSTYGSYAVKPITSNGAGNILFTMPQDLAQVSKIALIGIPSVSFTDENIQLTSNYSVEGMPSNDHVESDLVGVFSGVQGELTALDVKNVFTHLSANVICGLQIDHKLISATMNYVGVGLHYIPII